MNQQLTGRTSVLLLGARGFIGRRLLEALQRKGYEVTCGVHNRTHLPECRCIDVDFTRDQTEADWLPRLAGIDVVINAVGILRETRAATFEALHVAAPRALFSACARTRVKKVVQISALGTDEEAVSHYHRSKKVADDALAALPIPWVIVQPSLVFGEGGASAALFTWLAALPVVPLPGNGGQQVQPIHIDDLTTAIVRLIECGNYDRQRVPAVGPRPVTLRELLGGLRRAMRLGDTRFLHVPMFLVRAAAAIGDKVGRMLLDRESLGMLTRGNVASPSVIAAVLGRLPRPVECFIPAAAAHAIATEARLSWLLPLLRWTVAFVWIVTGIVSVGIYPVEESYKLLARTGLTGIVATASLYGAALLDFFFGVGVLVFRRRLWLWRAQMALILTYSVIITVYLPEFWLHPYGPLVKNLPLLVAILILHEFEHPPGR